MAITFRGAGSIVGADNANVTPALFESPAAGDLLLCHAFLRDSNGSLANPSGWNLITGHPLDTTAGHRTYLFWKVAAGADSNPLVSVSGAISGAPVTGICSAFRGTHAIAPIGTIGAAYANNTTTANIGPITAVAASQTDGAVIIIGQKSDDWTSVDLLTGDGLTWVEAYDTFYNPLTNDCGSVMDYSIWVGAAPALTDKTFVVNGGTNSKTSGQMIVLVPAGQPTIKRFGLIPGGSRMQGVW